MNKETVITSEGLLKLETELDDLKTNKRRDIAEKIKTALSFGDLSENSEYDEAKNEQAILESRISELEHKLKNVRILDEDDISTERVAIGSKIRVMDLNEKVEENYQIVGSTEADPLIGRISDESPVGRSFLNCVVGDILEIETPGGIVGYEVLEISK